MSKNTEMNIDPVVVEAVSYLGGNSELMSRFLEMTGADANDIVATIAQTGTQSAILEFFLNHEPSLLEFCSNRQIKPELVNTAFMRLSGANKVINSI